MTRAAKHEARTGANNGPGFDRSEGFSSRAEYTAHLEAMAKTGKLNRKLRRGVAVAQRNLRKARSKVQP